MALPLINTQGTQNNQRPCRHGRLDCFHAVFDRCSCANSNRTASPHMGQLPDHDFDGLATEFDGLWNNDSAMRAAAGKDAQGLYGTLRSLPLIR